ncbi:MAG: hypothetical protein KDD58_00280, partial [Bdellovibrionales bacterium]|nr:hypothetical protein [Bdellovibrionales bacterium]
MKHQLKKNFYKALTYLPQKTQNEIWRAKINIPSQFSKKLCVKIAENHQELEESFRLVYENYLQMGYCAKNPHKMRATIYHALPTTTTLIAKYNGKIIGTLTIVRDNRLGLPSESIFNYKPLRIHSNRLAEITSLTIDKEFRRKRGGEVFFPLLKFMYDYCTYYFGVNHLLVTIAPKEIPFYKSILLFKQHQDSKIKDYLGAPAISLQLDLQQALYDYESIYKDKAKNKNLFKFFVEDQLEQLKF